MREDHSLARLSGQITMQGQRVKEIHFDARRV
jgi:hypothetical protein